MSLASSEVVAFEAHLFPPSLGEILAAYARRLWPAHTAKEAARAWGIDPDTAKNVTRGHASERVLRKAIAREGWPFLMALGEATTGTSYTDWLTQRISEQEAQRARLSEQRDRVRAMEERACFLGLLEPGQAPARNRVGDLRSRLRDA